MLQKWTTKTRTLLHKIPFLEKISCIFKEGEWYRFVYHLFCTFYLLHFVDFIFSYQLLNGLSLWCLLDTRSFLFRRKRLQRRCVHHTFPALPQRHLHHFHHQRLFCIHLIFLKVGRHIWIIHSPNFYLTHANEKWRKKK